MKLSVERMPESRVLLDIAADEDEFAQAVDRAYRKVSREITLPGFRRGKAPRTLIERTYGRGIFVEEAQKEIMEDLYRRALEQESVVPVGEPEVDIVTPEPLEFRVVVPVYPTVEPGPYQEVRVEPADASVDEEAVDEVLERLRTSQSPWVDPAEPRTPQEGDQVTVDLEVKEGEETFQEPVEGAVFVLGQSNLLEPLREQIERMQVGETATLEIPFAEDDESVNEALRGKTLTYTITLTGLKERDLLPLDDEFAKTVGDVDTLEALRKEIRDDLHQARTAEARASVVNEIVDRMTDGATVEPPAVMIDEAVGDEIQSLRTQLSRQGRSLEDYLRSRGMSEEDLRAEVRPNATRRLRNMLVVREIAKREGIAVSDEDVRAEVAAMAGPEASPERVESLAESDYFRRVLRSDLYERRVTDRLIEIATEGRGAVVNGWIEPEPASEAGAASGAGEVPAGGEESALEGALTTGTMPGQPGDIAAVAVDDVAGEPDVAQAAAAGHDEENAEVAAAAPTGAVTPEEREAEAAGTAGGSPTT